MLYVDRIGDAVRRVSLPERACEPGADRRRAGRRDVRQPPADGGASTAPRRATRIAGDVIMYEWDLDGDGELDDSTDPEPTFTYMQGGTFTVALRVTDTSGDSDTDTLTITVGSGPSAQRSTRPAPSTTWGAGQAISFSGGGTDVDGGALPGLRARLGRAAPPLRRRRTATSTRSATTPTPPAARSPRPTTPSPARSRSGSRATTPTARPSVKTVDARPAHRRRVARRDSPPERRSRSTATAITAPATHPVVVDSSNTLEPRSPRRSATRPTGSRRGATASSARAASRRRGDRAFSATFVAAHPWRLRPSRSRRRPTPGSRPRNRRRTSAPRTGCAPTATAPSDIEESYLRFQVAGITGRVTSAKLRLRLDHQHGRWAGGARHHERLVGDRHDVGQPPGAHDRRGQRRGRDRQPTDWPSGT